MTKATILILGGTQEARELAQVLAGQPAMNVITSLAGRTAVPHLPPGRIVQGGFGGIDGLVDFIADNHVTALIDATHPFAARMGMQAGLAADRAQVPLLRLERPAWTRQPDDRWDEVDDWDQAVIALKTNAQRILLAIGRQELAPFAGLDHLWFLIRSVERPDPMPPFSQCEFLAARGPFSVADETALLRAHAIDTIVCKNSGGTASAAKLVAARELGLRVVMLRRPARPVTETVTQIDQAVVWAIRVRSPAR
ncbi:Precorrin-6A reductase [Magnetospirillum sp. LM-5]|uniref:cobalt-precorrin-6A reductase n=1 Tax=Magnetospirillum sp. LM-5 TaxID=2681466 RepID=UPI0013802CC6|nr:cobalt-precorrin-6A reductase [Magnetospirillum sp. LM-5]CAA7615412.1 Precorrin-6A reductase [Magnetospirillum sp. LM-5]